jgi:hypothetical protein
MQRHAGTVLPQATAAVPLTSPSPSSPSIQRLSSQRSSPIPPPTPPTHPHTHSTSSVTHPDSHGQYYPPNHNSPATVVAPTHAAAVHSSIQAAQTRGGQRRGATCAPDVHGNTTAAAHSTRVHTATAAPASSVHGHAIPTAPPRHRVHKPRAACAVDVHDSPIARHGQQDRDVTRLPAPPTTAHTGAGSSVAGPARTAAVAVDPARARPHHSARLLTDGSGRGHSTGAVRRLGSTDTPGALHSPGLQAQAVFAGVCGVAGAPGSYTPCGHCRGTGEGVARPGRHCRTGRLPQAHRPNTKLQECT